jgi:hypothetical protein
MEWADYGIVKAEYDHKNHRIVQAMVIPHPYYNSNGERVYMERDRMVRAMREGKSFVTVHPCRNRWRKGQPLFLMDIDGDTFIRMRHSRVPMDSHERIPEWNAQRQRTSL